jgi:hypothetical protein
MGMRLANGNWSDSLADTPANQAKYGAGSGYAGGDPGYSGTGTTSNPSNPTPPAATQTSGASQLSAGINSMLGAIASGNKAAFDEAVRQFNATFGLDQSKFNESVRQYNEGLGVTQAGLTGTYQGQQTQQAQQQLYAQQMGAITAAANLQANPFRQQQVLGQLGRVLGGQSVAGFSAPNTVAGVGTQGGNTQGGMGYMNQLISDIQNPGANQASVNSVLDGIPTPNKINSADFLRAAPSTQNMILQGMQEKYGLDPADSLQQIKNTMPSFNAPTTFGQIKG